MIPFGLNPIRARIAIAGGGFRLAAKIRESLAASFGPGRAKRTQVLGARIATWRPRSLRLAEFACLTDEVIEAARWMH